MNETILNPIDGKMASHWKEIPKNYPSKICCV